MFPLCRFVASSNIMHSHLRFNSLKNLYLPKALPSDEQVVGLPVTYYTHKSLVCLALKFFFKPIDCQIQGVSKVTHGFVLLIENLTKIPNG